MLRRRRDLLAIGRYIARDNPRAARAWIERLRERARLAAETPLAGRVVLERADKKVLEVFVRNYRIVYSVRSGAIHILTVFEGHKDVVKQLAERFSTTPEKTF